LNLSEVSRCRHSALILPHADPVSPSSARLPGSVVARKAEIPGQSRYKEMRQSADSCKEILQIVVSDL